MEPRNVQHTKLNGKMITLAVESYLGSALYSNFGWYGFCSIGIVTQLIAMIVHIISSKKR